MLPETRSELDGPLSVRAPAWHQARRARFLPASSGQFTAHGFARKPLSLLLAAPEFRIALSEQLIQAIARPMLRLHDQPTALDSDPDFCPRPQLQQVEQSRSTASMIEPPTLRRCVVRITFSKLYFSLTFSFERAWSRLLKRTTSCPVVK